EGMDCPTPRDEIVGKGGVEPTMVADAMHVDEQGARRPGVGPPLLPAELETIRPSKGRFQVNHTKLRIEAPGDRVSGRRSSGGPPPAMRSARPAPPRLE